MKILVDMNLSPLWIPFLEQHGFEAVHWSNVGSVGAADSQILDHADAGGYVIFTHDLDFGMLLAMRRTRGPSVLQIRTQDVLPSAVVNALHAAASHLATGALVSVDPAHRRVRILPI
jgi:predicted nuclease of predicted toxin-antitoxin system